MTSELLFSQLAQQREEKISKESIQRKQETKIQRINHEMLNQFFTKLKNWHLALDAVFMRSLSDKVRQGTLCHYSGNDMYIVSLRDQFAKKLTLNSMQWLEKVKLIIEEKMIKSIWAQFYDDLDSIFYISCKQLEALQRTSAYVSAVKSSFDQVMSQLDVFFSNPKSAFEQILTKFFLNWD